jgi:tetratricopeptide (TPR) repeat protein
MRAATRANISLMHEQDEHTKDPSPSISGDETCSKNPLLKCVLRDLRRWQTESNLEETAKAWCALGLIRLHTQRNPTEAIRCHKEALRLYQQDPIENAVTLNDLGLCYERLNQQDKALQTYKEASRLLDLHLSESHPTKLAVERSLARLHRN